MMRRFATILAAVGLMSGAAFAQTCLDDQFEGKAVCTANDIDVSKFAIEIVAVHEGCGEGDIGSAVVDVKVLIPFKNAQDRYDIGAFVASDGGDALEGTCARDYLKSGDGGAVDTDLDTCWDVNDTDAVIVVENAVVACGAKPWVGNTVPSTVNVCVSWDNNESNSVCSGVDDLGPGTPSKCYCGSDTIDIPLPVELVSFASEVAGSDVVLTWRTASESSNAGFSIEHSSRGMGFREIGFVTGAGTTTEAADYAFRARELAPGKHLFRLKQVDFDGSFVYSAEIEAVVAVPNRYVLEAAYPNPFNPQTSINFLVAESAPVRVALFNALGREVRELYRGTPEANQAYTVKIDGAALPSGTYIVRLEGNNFTGTQQVVLLK